MENNEREHHGELDRFHHSQLRTRLPLHEPEAEAEFPEPPHHHSSSSTTTTTTLLSPVVLCILATETGERFAYYGFRAILILYLIGPLQYQENQAIALVSYTIALAYLSPLLGAILADGRWGKYRTILLFGWIYVLGLMVLTVSAARSSGPAARHFTLLALGLVCLGTGGIKPCVSAFGADQIPAAWRRPRSMDPTMREPVDLDSHARSGPPIHKDGATGLSTLRPEEEEHHDENEWRPSDPPHLAQLDDDDEAEDPVRAEQVRRYFNAFYFCINVGAVASFLLVPWARQAWGFTAAFLLATWVMVAAMVLFMSQQHQYVQGDRDGSSSSSSLQSTLRLVAWLCLQQCPTFPGLAATLRCLRPRRDQTTTRNEPDGGSDHGPGLYHPVTLAPEDDDDDGAVSTSPQYQDATQVLQVLPIMALLPVFWCLYDQQGSVWTLQANRMALHGLEPEQLNMVNPIEIMLFLPLFDGYLYPRLEAQGWSMAPLRRMAWGMMWAALSFFMSGFLESVIQQRARAGQDPVHVFWQLPQITLLSVAEILVSVTSLEFAYATSPVRLKSVLTAIYLLTTTAGDLLSGVLYSTVFARMNQATVLHVCAGLMLLNLLIFLFVERWYNKQNARSSRSDHRVELQMRST